MKSSIYLLLVSLFIGLQGFAQNINHKIKATIIPGTHTIEVVDEVSFPAEFLKNKTSIDFYLNKNLTLEKTSIHCEKKDAPSDDGFSRYSFKPRNSKKDLVVTFEYKGVIFDDFGKDAGEYARGFSETTGIISETGVYLANSSYWIPSFDALFTFSMAVSLPEGWDLMSQGERSKEKNVVSYNCNTPQEEAYLIAAKFTLYEDSSNPVLLQAFLRTADKELADKYLKWTGIYMKMYEDMLGPYPYSKFALVENFWETGYGMPSFTLLGEKIIRFPFIIYSSYPHEMLHNYWGNSVYVNFDKGNWCEGVTAYMADHMLKEQRGQGADYRRNTLQKFTDFVNEENDFPLNSFINRNNAAEEAIGYGKCLMMNHMLRKEVGDELFLESYRKFYTDNKFHVASWDDIRIAFEETTGRDFKSFFELWVNSKGAPNLHLSDVRKEKTASVNYNIYFTLEQIQKGEFFEINIPVAFYFKDTVIVQKFLMNQQKQQFIYQTYNELLRIEIDPQFDVFRTLDNAEVPPALSQVFGESDGIIILPADSKYKKEYDKLAITWQENQKAQGKKLKIVYDNQIEVLPKDASVWVIGFENKFYKVFEKVDLKAELGSEANAKAEEAQKTGSWVMVIKNPDKKDFTIGFVGTNVPEAVPGLARLLPHYGKYSYLGFSGERPDNFLKGNFKASGSPLHYTFPGNSSEISRDVRLIPAQPLTKMR